MEPISQAVLGIMGQGLRTRTSKFSTAGRAFLGALGGLFPDIDFLIRVSDDPLFTIEYHRQFTHSLLFIPFGSLIVCLLLKPFKINIKDSYPYVFLGYATHGLLDAFTNYGTQLWWPFSDKREAWNCVAVVDPLLTIPLIILMYFFVKKRNTRLNFAAWGLLAAYLSFGFYQKSRVENILRESNIINQEIERFMIKPTIGNNFIWRVILEDAENLSFYGVRLSLFSNSTVRKGDTVKKVKESEVLELLANNPIQLSDYHRFKYFTDSYLFWNDHLEMADGRYSLLAHSKKPIWSIKFRPEVNGHVDYFARNRVSKEERQELLNYLMGN